MDENKLVDHLKDAIKEKKMYRCLADELQLFVARIDGAWLVLQLWHLIGTDTRTVSGMR
ncbi:hypothetical protein PC129_g5435 [Phytophthora cactorum]|uniref:Crinkler effector protein N-terminal domain-containing protein n=1 Tax=Phytophthora cactorum TaxID=29920 RepID=A0A329STS8_9STRA|nr:hypothetical protein Pcac1_g14882 [Phytophthora cactorum]KAG2797490.1 hypothetical protein PC111_g21273 [Phytophthora cactorum]KAG2832995.1 hypothetical protein PC112_g6669 [Phytophthora cactorum]KAG2860879.1 hypothetical protein PC113_g7654 [Phytophthora cactorum]KAG2915502.1 hypothetical protein PC115_g11358 [Phytophthora cactorum]